MSNSKTAQEIEHARSVRAMFSGIAPRYDVLNHVLSANIDKRWRRIVRDKLAHILADPNAVVLDVACGTGDLAIELNTGGHAKIVGTDFCRPMLVIAREKCGKLGYSIPFIEADAMNLSFADDSFDSVTIAFGLRNLANFADGVSEFRRVLKPGGTLAVLEFSAPWFPGFRNVFNFYFSRILPRIGGMVSGSRDAYEYLPNSVSRFPDQKGLAELLQRSGFTGVEYTDLTGGIAAIHTGKK